MKKLLLLTMSLVALATLPTQAQSTNSQGKDTKTAKVVSLFSSQTLKNTYISSGVANGTMGPIDYVPVDGVNTINCPATGTKTCLVQADQWVQFGGSSAADNPAGICLYVDGALINNGCYWAGIQNTGYYNAQFSTSQGVSVKGGNHTVQTQVISQDGGTFGYYSITYRVYTH